MSAAPKNVDWVAVEGAYRAGKKTLRAMAEEFGTAPSTIKSRAKKFGWIQDAAGTKRRMVSDRMSGVAQGIARNAMCEIEAAADQDVQDMNLALRGARLALQATVKNLEECPEDPRAIKTLSECIRINVETIRIIRGLNDPSSSVVLTKEERDVLASLP